MPHLASRNQWNKYVRYKMFAGALYWGALLALGGAYLAAKALGVV
jgi:hypothetical protein